MEASAQPLVIAVVGCAHGSLDLIYKYIRERERNEKVKVDLLLCCGDFECARDESDLEYLQSPAKFRLLKDFWKYYTGKCTSPLLTVFIGLCEASDGQSTLCLKSLFNLATPKFSFLFSEIVLSLATSIHVHFCCIKLT